MLPISGLEVFEVVSFGEVESFQVFSKDDEGVTDEEVGKMSRKALIHASIADARGNAVLAGAHFVDKLMVQAAKTVLLQVERVVSTEEIARHPVGTTIPGFLIHGVVEVAGGCYPTASHGAYNVDEEQIKLYMSMAGSDEGVRDYLRQNVTGVTEDEYLGKAAPRLDELRYGDGPSSDARSGRRS
jgi:hypothetical protein